MNPIIHDLSIKRAAIIAGTGLLIMAIIAPISNFAILQQLVVPDDKAMTTANITASEGLFRIGICLFLVVALLDIIVAWALYVFLKPINKSLSLLAAWFRLAYAALLAFDLIFLLNVLQLINGQDYFAAYGTDLFQTQVLLSVNTFTRGWEFGLIIFGIHLLLIGYLILQAGYMKKVLGVLLILAAMGYMIDGLGKLLSPHYDSSISMITFIGEVVLIFWLLIKGIRIKADHD